MSSEFLMCVERDGCTANSFAHCFLQAQGHVDRHCAVHLQYTRRGGRITQPPRPPLMRLDALPDLTRNIIVAAPPLMLLRVVASPDLDMSDPAFGDCCQGWQSAGRDRFQTLGDQRGQ